MTYASSHQPRTLLLATDSKHSIFAELAGGRANSVAYSVYGHQTAQQNTATHLGFNGELREMSIGWYLLGNGYRAYNPVLMRFHSPDSWSPFGKGGLNAYMYCGGDPVSFSDPTGHMGLWKAITRRLSRGMATRTAERAQQGMANPSFIKEETLPEPIYQNISEATKDVHKAMRMSREEPPPPKMQRFNDTGGRVTTLSSEAGQPSELREVWKSESFHNAPVPPARSISEGVERHYYVRYDDYGTPTQSSVQNSDLSHLQRNIRNANK